MHIQQAAPGYIPKTLSTEILATPRNRDDIPGLIVSAHDLHTHNSIFAQRIEGLMPGAGSPTFVISPNETSCLFEQSAVLPLLKSVTGLIAKEIHPMLKIGVDAIWLVYGAARLKKEWNQPDRDIGACIFKMTGLVLGSANLAGGLYPDLKLSDPWFNGINFVVKSGESIWQGKTVPVNELMLSTDKRLDIPLKVFKLVGLSLDPQVSVQNSTVSGYMHPTISQLNAKQSASNT